MCTGVRNKMSTKYEIKKNDRRKVAIFNAETGQQVSQWWWGIYASAI